MPPALEALASSDNVNIDGFILPGHVSVIVGLEAYRSFFDKYQSPCVVAGFEATDLLIAISMLVDQIETKNPKLENAYKRAVTSEGNLKALKLLREVFDVVDTGWRGIGVIARSGLVFKEKYKVFDAENVFNIRPKKSSNITGCSCGEILMGVKIPTECKLYRNVCNPTTPVGPCMVSSEGTCAAYYRYNNDFNNY